MTERIQNVLTDKLVSCGLPQRHAEDCARLYCALNEPGEAGANGNDWKLPTDEQLQTLAEAQRIHTLLAKERHYASELGDYQVLRFLQTPCEAWQSAKKAAAECFGRSGEEIDALYCTEEEWLLVPAGDVYLLAEYLKPLFSDESAVWRIFSRAALLGADKARERITSVLDLLGSDIGRKLICADSSASGWLFYRFYTDPVGAIAYMLECGMTPEKVLKLIEEDSFILYMYKEGRKRSYNHDQEQIDLFIKRFLE